MPWPVLLLASRRALAWRALAGTGVAALGLAALATVLPPAGAAQLPGLALLVLGCGLGATADDPTAALTAATPVTARRRLAARAVLALPVSAVTVGGVALLAAAGGVPPTAELVRSWVVLAVLALGAGAAGSRYGLPGALSATVLLGVVLVLQTTLPEAVRQAWPWDSTVERVVLGLLLAAVLLAGATRDPAARSLRSGAPGRRRARPRAAACRSAGRRSAASARRG
ncbi:hypothetical protein [Blastococcus sp. URHD0036]|uniref:hypothetical protein n=1 Tax=Blastococcus sp. URHD0036 TaxID=1380356 RepID=UPI0012DC04DE|nr:hypothetical protein [Blastococcus sp. URHD0036]